MFSHSENRWQLLNINRRISFVIYHHISMNVIGQYLNVMPSSVLSSQSRIKNRKKSRLNMNGKLLCRTCVAKMEIIIHRRNISEKNGCLYPSTLPSFSFRRHLFTVVDFFFFSLPVQYWLIIVEEWKNRHQHQNFTIQNSKKREERASILDWTFRGQFYLKYF